MATSLSKVQRFLLYAIVPILCSIALGFVFYQNNVFDRHYGAFQFVWSGVVASLLYYTLVFLRPRDFYLGLILLFFVTLLTTESTRPSYILRDLFYVGGIGVSMFLYFTYFRQSITGNQIYIPFVLAGVYAVIYIIVSEIHLGILHALALESTGGTVVTLASASAFFGVLIGFAVGCGIALNERLWGLKKSTNNVATA